MKRLLVLATLLAASCSLLACAPEDTEDSGESSNQLTGDIRSMVVNPDGTYTVTCKDGSVEKKVTAEEIEASAVCNPADADTDADATDGSADASTDGAIDASKDAAIDAPKDAAVDAPKDAAIDAPKDAGADVKDATADAKIPDASADAAKDAAIDG